MSTSRLSNKRKSKLCWDPILVRLSAYLLVSRKQCLIWICRNWDARCLQSSTRGELAKLKLLVLVNICYITTIALASISTSTRRKFLARQIVSPSRRAKSLAKKLEALPTFLENPITQCFWGGSVGIQFHPSSRRSLPSNQLLCNPRRRRNYFLFISSHSCFAWHFFFLGA